jgi:hypothetical protein
MPTMEQVQAAIRRLTSRQLLVGVPQERDPRPGEPIGNASLAYIHNYGSPAVGIPARPFMEPGIEQARPEINQYLREAAIAALDGDIAGIDRSLARAGMTAVDSIRGVIQAGIPPPLSPRTVARRRNRRSGSSYRRRAQTPADVVPLIDTGSMLAAITYVIRNR